MLHKLLNTKQIVLASASPRRSELLKLIGLKFITIPADIDEDFAYLDQSSPLKYVKRIAIEKCNVVKDKVSDDCLVISADTIVYHDKQILLKPNDPKQTFSFLQLLSGKTHQVYTGVCISYNRRLIYDYAKTYVTFKDLSETEIIDYISTNEPSDKAGAYGIQGYGSQFIEKINGCYFNVMGFPINLFYKMVVSGL